MSRFTKTLRSKGMRKLSTDRKLHKKIYDRSKRMFERSKRKMLEEFQNHPVTKEIESGPHTTNTSGTITGGAGNLYSFIGFHDGADPIQSVYSMLNASTYIKGRPKVSKKTKDRVYLEMEVNFPSKDSLAAVSPMPWEPGSWLFKIEKGISGLGYYIYQTYLEGSRSGTGLQGKKKTRQAMYRRTPYMSAILNTFKRRFTR